MPVQMGGPGSLRDTGSSALSQRQPLGSCPHAKEMSLHSEANQIVENNVIRGNKLSCSPRM